MGVNTSYVKYPEHLRQYKQLIMPEAKVIGIFGILGTAELIENR